MAILDNVKALLGSPEGLDDKLALIVELTTQRLCLLLGTSEVPEKLSYIVVEVAIKRFNRIGSEGYQSHSLEGMSITFGDDNDFMPFMSDIEAWHQAQKDGKATVRFL